MKKIIEDYYNGLDWENMTDEDKVVNEAEKRIALGANRNATVTIFRGIVHQMENSGLTEKGKMSADDIRTYDEIIQAITQTNEGTPEPEAQEESVVPEPRTCTNVVELFIEEDMLGVTFDESNSDEDEDSNFVINRRGSGRPVQVTPTVEQEPEQEGSLEEPTNSESEGVATIGDLGMTVVVRGGQSNTQEPAPATAVLLGKDVEDGAKEFVHENPIMMSYFSLMPVTQQPPTGVDRDGNTPVDFAVSIIYLDEGMDTLVSGGEPEEYVDSDVVIAPSLEGAIDLLQQDGYVFNKNKNIFIKVDGDGSRSFARVVFDVDLRGVLG